MPRYTSKPSTSHVKQPMEDFSSFDVPSPSGSLYYVYGDADQYLESHTSESQSPNGSLVSFPNLVCNISSDCESCSTIWRQARITAVSPTYIRAPSGMLRKPRSRHNNRSRRPRGNGRTGTRTPLPPFCR